MERSKPTEEIDRRDVDRRQGERRTSADPNSGNQSAAETERSRLKRILSEEEAATSQKIEELEKSLPDDDDIPSTEEDIAKRTVETIAYGRAAARLRGYSEAIMRVTERLQDDQP